MLCLYRQQKVGKQVDRMGELFEPYPKLPKNIRQIGERDDIVRVYVEDYVNTYLKRLFPTGGQDLRAGILLGNTEEHDGLTYVFIDGALEMEGVTEEGEKVVFTEEAWKKAYQTMEEMFPKRTVQGWFLCGAPGCQLSPLNYWKQHGQYFSGKHKLMYLNSGLEGDEALYITSSDGFYKLRGHCIYYERNQMMQDYMVSRKDGKRVEAGGSDPVIRDFRRKMERKKKLAESQNQRINFLRGMCACLAILALAGGVAAFNSAERLKEAEAVAAAVLPDIESMSDIGKDYLAKAGIMFEEQTEAENRQPGRTAVPSDGLIIEEVPGDIFPTIAEPEERLADDGSEIQLWQTAGEGAPGEGADEKKGEAPENGAGAEAIAVPKEEAALGEAAAGGTVPETGEAQKEITDSGGGTAPQDTAGEGNFSGEAAEAAKEVYDGGSDEHGEESNTKAPPKEESAAEAFSMRQTEPKPGQGVYVVEPGETLYGICLKLYQNLSKVDEICRINGLEDINMLEAGKRLIVP